jgi:hypothetical protein
MKSLNLVEVNNNGIGHKVVEKILKSTITSRGILVENLWVGKNITEVALVSFCAFLLFFNQLSADRINLPNLHFA